MDRNFAEEFEKKVEFIKKELDNELKRVKMIIEIKESLDESVWFIKNHAHENEALWEMADLDKILKMKKGERYEVD